MAITVSYDLSGVKWNAIPWSPSIAQSPMDASYADYLGDGVRFTGIGSKPYSGQLWNYSLPLLPIPNPFTATFGGELMFDDACAGNLQAAELDMMAVNAAGNVGNGSGQLNVNEGGVWQSIVNEAWTNIPNFAPTMPVPNQWTPFSVTHNFDPAKEQSEFDTVKVGNEEVDAHGVIPAQPYAKLNWAPNALVVQIQITLGAKGGYASFKIGKPSVTVVYQ